MGILDGKDGGGFRGVRFWKTETRSALPIGRRVSLPNTHVTINER